MIKILVLILLPVIFAGCDECGGLLQGACGTCQQEMSEGALVYNRTGAAISVEVREANSSGDYTVLNLPAEKSDFFVYRTWTEVRDDSWIDVKGNNSDCGQPKFTKKDAEFSPATTALYKICSYSDEPGIYEAHPLGTICPN